MKDLSLYDPEICDGDFCPMDCSRCYKADEVLKLRYEEEELYEEENDRDD